MISWNTRRLRNGARYTTQSIDPVIGTTTNDSIEVIDLDVRQMTTTVFTVSNTGSNSLFYSVKVRNEYDNGAEFEVFFNKIVAAKIHSIALILFSVHRTVIPIF